MKLYIATLLALLVSTVDYAQDISYEALHEKRIKTNSTGMLILTGWGGANLAAGITGYALADDMEWRSFHGMNALWGAVNGTIGILGYMGARKEAGKEFDKDEAYARYKQSKKIYLINAGLDVLYIGSGAALVALSDEFNKPLRWSGFGKSIIFQGAALLVFDAIMYGILQTNNEQWTKLVSGLHFTGSGIGYTYRF